MLFVRYSKTKDASNRKHSAVSSVWYIISAAEHTCGKQQRQPESQEEINLRIKLSSEEIVDTISCAPRDCLRKLDAYNPI